MKQCLICKKEINMMDYPKYFSNRRYCSPSCAKVALQNNSNKWRINSSLGSWKTKHGEALLKINNLINGNLIGAKVIANTYEPDIIKEDTEIELESISKSHLIKFKNKFKKERFDNKKPKKRILILLMQEELKEYFDEILIFNSPNFNQQIKDSLLKNKTE